MLKELFNRLVLLACVSCVVPVYANGFPDFTALVEKQAGAVVNISTSQRIAQPDFSAGDPFFEFFKRFAPQMPRAQESQSLGSGFIITADGYIMTNAHVVDHADKITVRLTDKREYSAKVIGADKRSDVALLKIAAVGLPKVVLGDPGRLKVGEWVIAIGSPFGFDSSVTAGIVSAKGRSLPQDNFVPFIQTDVAINPGNSGGPLFNMSGEVVGINSQIYTRSGGSMGLSFAIPIDVATQVTDQLRSTGSVARGRIGVTIQEMTRELAESFGLSQPEGALISSVEKGGPADKAGIEPSDVILKFDGKPVASSADLPRIVSACKPGSKVKVELWRKGATRQVIVEVVRMQDESVAEANRGDGAGRLVDRLGLVLTDSGRAESRSGLQVLEVKGSAAKAAGIQAGDVLLALGNTPLRSLNQLIEIIRPLPAGRNIALLVRRGDSASYFAIRLDEK